MTIRLNPREIKWKSKNKKILWYSLMTALKELTMSNDDLTSLLVTIVFVATGLICIIIIINM